MLIKRKPVILTVFSNGECSINDTGNFTPYDEPFFTIPLFPIIQYFILDHKNRVRMMDLGIITEEEQQKLVDIIKEPVKYGIPKWMVNRQKDIRTGEYRHISGTDLELLLKYDIDKMKRTRSWKGIRHMYGLKVRGQRTRTTGRRGLVVGYYRKDMKKKGAL